MLIHTGVTKYIDFCAVDTSFVYTSGKVYKVPVTPAEAMATSLVGFFQKRNLRNFATYISEYVPQEAGPKDATATLETKNKTKQNKRKENKGKQERQE